MRFSLDDVQQVMVQVRDSGIDEDSMHSSLLIVNLDSAIDLPVSGSPALLLSVCRYLFIPGVSFLFCLYLSISFGVYLC